MPDYDINLDDKFGQLRLIRLMPERTTIVMVEPAGVQPTGD